MPEQLAISGGSPVRDTQARPWSKWPVYDSTEEQALLRVLHSGHWWYAEGEEGKAFEAEFAAFQDAKHAVACVNGTTALEIALRALGVGYGDEVILPPYTFIATASAVITVGATPVFADVRGDALTIDPAKIEEVLTPRTKAIIAVHIAGRPADMDGVMEVARKHNLYVIEDAAQAHAAEWRGTKVGALGDLGTFSFQASKHLNAGEGGVVISNNAELIERAWSVTHVGRIRNGVPHRVEVLGGNYRITEFQSAILRAQMTRLPAQASKRAENANYLRSLLGKIEGVCLPYDDPRITLNAYHLFTWRYKPEAFGGRTKADLVKALAAEGIPCTSGYIPLYKENVFTQASQRNEGWRLAGRQIDYASLNLPVCEQVCSDSVWFFQNMLLGERGDMEEIAEALAKVQRAWR